MLNYKNGDIVDATEQLIAHGCKNMGVMNSGVAKAIRRKWSDAYTDYKYEYDQHGLSMGAINFSYIDDKIIANCITQDGYGYDGELYVDYIAIRKCFDALNKYCVKKKITEIAIPRIGAGLGGGDWDTIAPIILAKMTDVSVTVYIN